jgi:WD40 repeat protein
MKTLRGHTNWVSAVAFHADGTTLASGSGDHTVKIWNVETEQCIKTLHGHTNRVSSLAFCPHGNILISSSQDESIKIWNVQTGECLQAVRSEKPYEGMNILGITGLTEAQKATLKALGAIEVGTGHRYQLLSFTRAEAARDTITDVS